MLIEQYAPITLAEIDRLIQGTSGVNYSVFDVSLATALVNKEINAYGNFFGIISITAGASVDVRFNGISNQAITLNAPQRFFLPFNKFYLTCSAQAGASVKIFVGQNTQYVPPNNLDSISAYSLYVAHGSVAIGPTATALLPALSTRRQLVIWHNDIANGVSIGNDATITDGAGLPLGIGQERSWLSAPFYTGALYGICPAGVTISVYYWYQY